MKFYVPILILTTVNVFSLDVHHEETIIDQDHQEYIALKNDTPIEYRMLLESTSMKIMTANQTENEHENHENTNKGNVRKAKFNPDEVERDLSIIEVEDTTYKIDVSTTNSVHVDNENEHETTIHPTTKKAKQLEIYKTRPNELLRHYVEDTNIRPPIAALVDKKLNPLMKARQLWKSALRPKASLDVMLVSYDSEGIRSIYNISNTNTMMNTLSRIREENGTSEKSRTYYSIIRTGQLIPYDSAIFLSTDVLPNDDDHRQSASMILLKKRIRLYLIIFDESNNSRMENTTKAVQVRKTGFLGQLALRTGGDILYVPNSAFQSAMDKLNGEMGLITLVVGNKLRHGQAHNMDFSDVEKFKHNIYDRN